MIETYTQAVKRFEEKLVPVLLKSKPEDTFRLKAITKGNKEETMIVSGYDLAAIYQMALSRAREYESYTEANQLTDDGEDMDEVYLYFCGICLNKGIPAPMLEMIWTSAPEKIIQKLKDQIAQVDPLKLAGSFETMIH